MANYTVPAFSGAASGAAQGAAIGSIIPGLGTGIGAGVGALLGAGSSIFGTYSNEQQTSQMQNMINQNYQAIINAINNEYQTGMAGLGATYSAGQKAALARNQQTLGGQGLAGSPIAAAINSEWGSNAAIGAAGQETKLAEQKSAEIAQATAEMGQQNQQLQYAGLQAQNQQMNNSLNSWQSVGSMLGSSLKNENANNGQSQAQQAIMQGTQGYIPPAQYGQQYNFAKNPTTVNQLNNPGLSGGYFGSQAQGDQALGTNTMQSNN